MLLADTFVRHIIIFYVCVYICYASVSCSLRQRHYVITCSSTVCPVVLMSVPCQVANTDLSSWQCGGRVHYTRAPAEVSNKCGWSLALQIFYDMPDVT